MYYNNKTNVFAKEKHTSKPCNYNPEMQMLLVHRVAQWCKRLTDMQLF